MNIMWLRILTGRKETSCLFASVTKELNSGLLRTTPADVHEHVTLGYQVRHPHHLAIVPPKSFLLNSQLKSTLFSL